MTFPKILLGKILRIFFFFFGYFSHLLLTSSFFNKDNFCEIENSTYFDVMVKIVYFLEYFFILQNNYWSFKVIFGNLFSVYFQTQLTGIYHSIESIIKVLINQKF